MALLINAALVLLAALALSQASVIFGPKRRMNAEKGLPYETGMTPIEDATAHMWVSYYRFAVLFVIFDVDLIFLAPWILLRHSLSLEMMVSMTVFVFLIALTLAYVWRKGALKCN